MKTARWFFILIATLLLAGLGLSTLLVRATCVPSDTGTPGDDTITCDVANPPVSGVVGGDGNDTITIGAGVVVTAVSGGTLFGAPETGNDIIVNDGTVLGPIVGDAGTSAGGGDDVIVNNGSSGDIEGDTSSGAGSGDDIIVNNGTANNVSGDTGFGVGTGNDTIINNGTAAGVFGDSADGGSSGNDTITNNGVIQSDIFADGSGGFADGNDTVTNNGYIVGSIYGDGGLTIGTGSDTITNNGTVTNIGGAGGNDTITNNGIVNGDILAGDGNDTVIIQGGVAVVGDSINGGNDYDVLTFNLSSTNPAELEAAAAVIAAANPAGGTITINGITYTWLNFEELTQILNIVRLNGLADPLALFCAVTGGIDIYNVVGQQGFISLYVSPQQISNGVAHALSTGTDILIGSSSTAQVYALSSGELRVNGPNGFSFLLVASRCGVLPAPQPFQQVVEEEIESGVIINRPR
jgi:hypothetical protein